ncbi:hypothetical protein Tco_0838906 [Tanacetum coccineum]|uniref:STICHEL DnaA-N-like alpha-beta domain-containing protein n=1 Tax=Tanacetum coccineum TaxID=301880 RepID=A0ABQ5AQY6_9ASTR
MDLGIDPMVLMSQMATLIMDIIAGTYQVVEARYGDSVFNGRNLTEAELERLKHALKLLSEAEKQLRFSTERSTWFTAFLLQLGSVPSTDPTPSGSSRRQSSRTTDDEPSATFKDIYFQKQKADSQYTPQKSTPTSISDDKGTLVAYIVFRNKDIKSRAERFLSSITNSFETVLRRNIEVKIILLSDNETTPDSGEPDVPTNGLTQKQIGSTAMDDCSVSNSHKEPLMVSGSPLVLAEGSALKGKKSGNPVQRIESIIHEQRLETAWLQTAEKGTPGSLNRLKPERNQVLPQDSSVQMASIDPSQQQWEDELTRELNLLKINERKAISKEYSGNQYPKTPSLHDSKSKGYESGSGGGGCFCFNKPRQNRRGKMKPEPQLVHESCKIFFVSGSVGKWETEHRSRRSSNVEEIERDPVGLLPQLTEPLPSYWLETFIYPISPQGNGDVFLLDL